FGYYVAAHQVDDATLRRALQQRLPSYMVPVACMRLDVLPMTLSGKIDRRALPPVDPVQRGAAPAGEFERRLLTVWREVLGLDQLGIDDDFFEVGGHSLLAIKLADAVQRSLAVECPVACVVENPSVRSLAARLSAGTSAASPQSNPGA